MNYRNGNYAAFYVKEPFEEPNIGLGAHQEKDFRYYNLLRAWKTKANGFPFNDSHQKNYNVRDGSTWETLQARIRERLRKSKNIVLFLSSITKNSEALREEVDYGINDLGLPVIVVYPEFSEKSDIINCSTETIRKKVKDLWDKLPRFRDSMDSVPTIHVPIKKNLIRRSLENPDFMVQSAKAASRMFYKC